MLEPSAAADCCHIQRKQRQARRCRRGEALLCAALQGIHCLCRGARPSWGSGVGCGEGVVEGIARHHRSLVRVQAPHGQLVCVCCGNAARDSRLSVQARAAFFN